MKHLFILLMLLASQFSAISQITFEKSYPIINNNEIVALSTIEDGNGGSVLITGKKRGIPSFVQQFGLLHLNGLGDTLWYKIFSANYHPEIQKVKKTVDGFIVLGIADDTAQVNNQMWFVCKFDTSGNIFWTNYYSDPSLPGIENKVGIDITQSGNIFIYNGDLSFFTISSSTGVLLNSSFTGYNFYSSYHEFQSEKLIKKNNLYYSILYFSMTPPTNFNPKIVKVNEFADTLGSMQITLDSTRGYARFLKLLNNGFLILGSRTMVANDKAYFISKIDSGGNKIWNKRVPKITSLNCYVTSNTILTNGNIIISGFPRITSSLTTPPEGKAFLYCFNDNGDSLWYKEFSPSDTSLKTEFYDVIATADSGILACGQLLRTNGTRESYIVKLDANGNLFNPLSVLEKKNETYLHLYPNPANNYTSLHYIGAEKNVHVALCNLQGQTIETWQLANQEEYLKINMEHFSPGFYFCNISKDGRIVQSKKLVVIK